MYNSNISIARMRSRYKNLTNFPQTVTRSLTSWIAKPALTANCRVWAKQGKSSHSGHNLPAAAWLDALSLTQTLIIPPSFQLVFTSSTCVAKFCAVCLSFNSLVSSTVHVDFICQSFEMKWTVTVTYCTTQLLKRSMHRLLLQHQNLRFSPFPPYILPVLTRRVIVWWEGTLYSGSKKLSSLRKPFPSTMYEGNISSAIIFVIKVVIVSVRPGLHFRCKVTSFVTEGWFFLDKGYCSCFSWVTWTRLRGCWLSQLLYQRRCCWMSITNVRKHGTCATSITQAIVAKLAFYLFFIYLFKKFPHVTGFFRFSRLHSCRTFASRQLGIVYFQNSNTFIFCYSLRATTLIYSLYLYGTKQDELAFSICDIFP